MLQKGILRAGEGEKGAKKGGDGWLVSVYLKYGYDFRRGFLLVWGPIILYIAGVMRTMASVMGVTFKGRNMKRFVNHVWNPFVEPKKRILILAIAAYLALC